MCLREWGDKMAYETKVILTLLADRISKANSAKEAYKVVANAAKVEGLELPTFEEARNSENED